MKKILLLLIFILSTATAWAKVQGPLVPIQDQGDKRYGVSSGIKLMVMDYENTESEENQKFYAGEIPVVEQLFPIFTNDLLLFFNYNLTWGLSEFFFDFGVGSGLRYYPLGNEFVSIYGGGEAGTFFFNNGTLTARAGVDFDFKLDQYTSVYMGAEYFTRHSHHLADFITDDHWFITSDGWAINGGFRARFSFFENGLQNAPKIL